MSFLEKVPLTSIEKEKLERFLLDDAFDLYSLIVNDMESFSDFFGKNRTNHLIGYLYPLLTDKQRDFIFLRRTKP